MRKQETIQIKQEEGKNFGRDIDKIFRLTEMSAMQLEKWNAKAFSFFLKNMKEGNEKLEALVAQKESGNTAAMSSLSNSDMMQAVENIEDWLDLQNEHLYCYEFFEKVKGVYIPLTPQNIGDYVEETETLAYLREKAIELNCKSFITGNR